MLDDNMSLENEQSNDLPLTSDVGYNLESAQASALSSLSETAKALTVAINKITEYVPTKWVNGTEPDIDEDNLNKIEEGIKNATNAVNSSIDAITELAAAVDTLNGNLHSIYDSSQSSYVTDLLTIPFGNLCKYNPQTLNIPFSGNYGVAFKFGNDMGQTDDMGNWQFIIAYSTDKSSKTFINKKINNESWTGWIQYTTS